MSDCQERAQVRMLYAGRLFWVESEACYGYVVRRGEAGACNRVSCKGYATAAEAEAARRGVLQAAQAAQQARAARDSQIMREVEKTANLRHAVASTRWLPTADSDQRIATRRDLLAQARRCSSRGGWRGARQPSGFRTWQPAELVERELQRQMLERREPAGSLFHAFVSQVMVHDFEAVPAHLLHLENWTPVEALLESLRKYHADAAAVTADELRVLIQHKYAAHSFYQTLRYADWVKRLVAPEGAPKRVYRFPFQPRCP